MDAISINSLLHMSENMWSDLDIVMDDDEYEIMQQEIFDVVPSNDFLEMELQQKQDSLDLNGDFFDTDFEVKANLRQNLMMEFSFGFGNENDDEQEKEEELTYSNVTKNDAIVEGDCDCGQQETPARDREKDWNGRPEESTNCQSANMMHTNSSLSGFSSPNPT